MEKWNRNISIKELIWKVIFEWKKIVLCAIIFAVIATALRYSKDMRTYEAAKIKHEKAVEEQKETGLSIIEENFSVEELQQIQDASALQKIAIETREYLESSILMSINSFQEDVITLEYYIGAQNAYEGEDTRENYVQDIVYMYKKYLKNEELIKEILDSTKLDIEPRYIEELIFVYAEQGSSIFTIEVVYPDKEVLEDMVSAVKVALNSYGETLAQKMGSHELVLIAENASVRVDVNLGKRQLDYQTAMDSYRSKFKTLKSVMTSAQIAKIGESLENESEENIFKMQSPSISKVYMILGVFVGAFLAIVVIICFALFETRLQFVNEMVETYQLRLFGTLDRDKKRVALDRLLLKIKNRGDKGKLTNTTMKIICTNLELTCKNLSLDRIFITGTVMNAAEQKIVEEIKEYMAKMGVEVVTGENICYDETSLRIMAEVKNTILLEQIGASPYRDLEKEIELIKEYDGTVLGCIIIA